MDFKELAAALALSAGAVHPLGHVSEGGKRGVPIRVHYKNMAEHWQKEPKNAGDEAAIHGAGFQAQDDVARAIEDKDTREAAYLANAILKGGYAARVTDKLGKNVSGGDIGGMERVSGNRLTRPLVGFSAIMDLIKSQRPEQTWDVSAGPVGESIPNPMGPDADVAKADRHPAVGLMFRKRF